MLWEMLKITPVNDFEVGSNALLTVTDETERSGVEWTWKQRNKMRSIALLQGSPFEAFVKPIFEIDENHV